MDTADPVADPMTAPRPADDPTRISRGLALAALLGLIVLGLAWELWLAPTGTGTLAIKVLPLLPCVPGVLRFRMRTYRWLSILLWLYVTEGVVRAATEQGLSATLAGIEVVLALVLFAACVWQVRWRLKTAASR